MALFYGKMLEKSKRILLFTTAYKPFVGGSEIAIQNIIRRLPGVFFDIITPRHNSKLNRLAQEENSHIYRVGFGWKYDKYLFPVLGFFKALGLMRENNYQLIHAYQASQAAGAAWLLKLFKPKIKFVLTIQEGKDLDKQKLYVKFFRNLIVRKADIISGISSYLVDYVKIINRKAKTIVIPNGVDLNFFPSKSVENQTSSELKEKLGIKENNRLVVTVSRLVTKNGLENLIEATAKVRDRLPEVKLLVIGDGPLLKDLKSKVRKLNLTSTTLFLGEINHEDLAKYLRIADVFARPSQSEGLGSAFLEAMAVGVPIVGTPVGGIPDFLIDKETGLFCQVNNSSDLADKIYEILTNRELRVRIVNNAQALIRQKYDWDIIALKFENIYAGGI